ncbi:ATP-binding protein [Gorillibacterium sp. sgz5001074]|uniref:HAMP domain-containing sensor histidine kinase n=1 Tax=Gorillibacterium sp. sgz5001074 TaxID=3446695 RepID=UPI003F6706F8
MKISLKYRISLVFLAVMALYTLSILLYYRMVIMEQAAVDIRNFRDHFAAGNAAVSEAAGRLWNDKAALGAKLEEASRANGVSLKVYDLTGAEVFRYDYDKSGIWTFTAKEIVKREDKAVAFLEVRYPIQIRDIVAHVHSIANLLTVSLTGMGVSFLVLVIYIHFEVVKPLMRLHGSMKLARIGDINPPDGGGRKDEIGDLMANFRSMGERLESTHKEQTDMIAAISHDLRTPLTSIIGYVERLGSGKIRADERRQEYYAVIRQKAKDMERLIVDFASFSRSEAEAARPSAERVHVKPFFDSLFKEYAMELESNHAEFTSDSRLPEGIVAEWDVKGLRRIVANLVNNAMAYTKPPVRIHMTVKMGENRLLFTVEDNGPGVPEAERQHIFRRFYRVDPSRSRENGGTGLGLAICKSIAEAHGGSITAFDSPLGGLGIRVALPLS